MSNVKLNNGIKAEKTAKQQYRTLKKRFKFLVYENECYQEQLRNLQRKLLKLSRDKNFLLDRLQNFEKVSDSSDDSDAPVEILDTSDAAKATPSKSKDAGSVSSTAPKRKRIRNGKPQTQQASKVDKSQASTSVEQNQINSTITKGKSKKSSSGTKATAAKQNVVTVSMPSVPSTPVVTTVPTTPGFTVPALQQSNQSTFSVPFSAPPLLLQPTSQQVQQQQQQQQPITTQYTILAPPPGQQYVASSLAGAGANVVMATVSQPNLEINNAPSHVYPHTIDIP